jgi:hypothetical protein
MAVMQAADLLLVPADAANDGQPYLKQTHVLSVNMLFNRMAHCTYESATSSNGPLQGSS